MARKKRSIAITGKTEDGKFTLKGLFKFIGTHGLPAADLFHYIKEQGYVVDWIEFVNDARKDGWKLQTIFSVLDEALTDTYNRDYKNTVLKKLKKLYT